jgi:acyl carrier protein
MPFSQEEIIDALAKIIKEVADIDPSDVSMEKSFMDDLDLDSLSLVEIAAKVEEKFGLKIPDEDLAGLYTVDDAVTYIQKFKEENP